MKIILLLLLPAVVIALPIKAAAQSRVCTLENPPAFRGLQLGMKSKAFLSHFPGTRPINMYNREELKAFPRFAGLEMIAFRMSGGRLDQLEVRFRPEGQPLSADELVLIAAAELSLRIDAWEMEREKPFMLCPKFRLEVDPSTGAILITDLAAERKWLREEERHRRRGN